eukprot:966013-Rhodomonas_salina.1
MDRDCCRASNSPQLTESEELCCQSRDSGHGLALRCADSTPRWVTSQIPLSVVRRGEVSQVCSSSRIGH